MHIRPFLTIGFSAGLLAAAFSPALVSSASAAWPEKTIQLVVPFAAGGSTDTVARMVAAEMAKYTDQSIVVTNKPGAGSAIGSQVVARAEPDGYTILMGGQANVMVSLTYTKLSFDPVKDFAPVGLVVDVPNLLAVNVDTPYKNLADLIRAAKAEPVQIAYASAGNGTPAHLVCETFAINAGIRMTHVPYKGNAPAVTDLLGGQVPAMCNNLSGTLPYIRGDKMRILAVTGTKRSPAAPDVPTFAEAGIKGLNSGAWMAMLAPAATPKPVIARLSEILGKALESAELRKRLADIGASTLAATPAAAAERFNDDLQTLGPVVKRLGLKIE
ncbi:tripartite tricarboxylate transporter substrate binding protein [Comamonadaceae bacterium G21597-S1]|nr:tripartite tricarboxylate transporter substrate binding protein [Comamonadaceae bacterium G21597-S1]